MKYLCGSDGVRPSPAPAAVAPLESAGRPITLIVPFAPGGIADLVARTVTRAMSETLGRPILVDNRPSAGSVVGSHAAARAAPDGSTLLLMSNANAIGACLFDKMPFDVTTDFAPICALGKFDLALFVAADSKLWAVRDLIAEARARAGKLPIGTVAVGSTQYLAAELFEQQAGVDIMIAPYSGSPAVLDALRAGRISAAFEIVGPALPHVQANAVRTLAVTGDRRCAALPDVPTMREAGVADYEITSWNGLAAPAQTPQAVIDRLNAAANAALKLAAVADKLRELGVRPQGGTPQQMRALLEREIARARRVLSAAKIAHE